MIVKWRTQSKTPSETKRAGGIYRGIAGDEESGKLTDLLQGSLVGIHQDGEEEFTGLFIFEFDEEGRVGSHTIEHVDSGEGWEGVGWVGLTDWLLGKVGGRVEEPEPALAWSSEGKQLCRSTG